MDLKLKALNLTAEEISVVSKLLIYTDHRINSTFSDESSLIIHSGNACCTYFLPNNSQMRFFLSNAPMKESLRSKLNISIKLANLFCEKTILTDDQIDSLQNELLFFNHRKETSLWDLNSAPEYYDNGILMIRSIDAMAACFFDPSDQFFSVEYYYPLPKKKLVFMKGKEQFYSKNYKDKLNRPTFEYVKLRKFFNVLECPIRWQVPLFLCLQYCLENNISMRYKPAINQTILDIFSQENTEKFLQDGLQFFECFEFISSKEFLIKFQPDTHVFVSNGQKEQPISSENIWKMDKISPSADILNYDFPISFLIMEGYLVWILQTINELTMRSLLDGASIYSTNRLQFFHFLPLEREDESLFSFESLPITTQKIVNFAFKAVKLNQCLAENNREIWKKTDKDKAKSFVEHYKESNEFGTFIAYEDKMVKCCFADRTLVTVNDNENYVLILSKKGEKILQKLTEKNDFTEYVNISLNFKKRAFQTEKEKFDENFQFQERSELVNFELDKNSRFLNILNKRVPTEAETEEREKNVINCQRLQFSETDIQFDIQRELEKNQRFLDDLKKMLG